MNSTEPVESARLAAKLFDEVLAPLAQARRDDDLPACFAPGPDPAAASYYGPPTLARMEPADFEYPGGGTADGLVDALAEYWAARGDSSLAAMAPRLKRIAHALDAEITEGDGSVDILCYTMF